MSEGIFFMLTISDSLMYPGQSYRGRENYRRDIHWFINKKFPGYADRKFKSSAKAAVLAREIQRYFNVSFEITPLREFDLI